MDGELGEPQHIMMKVMQQPFSVYMYFLKPYAGREVLYVDGQNNGKMVVLEAGFKRMLGKMNLDPTAWWRCTARDTRLRMSACAI